MDSILAGLLNLGLGGIMSAALVWFLQHLVTQTLPDMTRAFRVEVLAERDRRFKEHQALLEAINRLRALIGKLGKQQRREHAAILQRLDLDFKQLVNEFMENRLAVERLLHDRQEAAAGMAVSKPHPLQESEA